MIMQKYNCNKCAVLFKKYIKNEGVYLKAALLLPPGPLINRKIGR